VLWSSAGQLANSTHRWRGGGYGCIIFQAVIVTCPTEFAASSQPSIHTVAVCVNGCFCHESYQIARQSEPETNRRQRRCLRVWKEVHRSCVCVVQYSICCVACYWWSLSDFTTVCCGTGGPGSKRCPARDRPLTWSKVLRSSLRVWVLSPFFVCCSAQIETAIPDLTFRNNNLVFFFVRIYWIS
jgi:hypothetical protein